MKTFQIEADICNIYICKLTLMLMPLKLYPDNLFLWEIREFLVNFLTI